MDVYAEKTIELMLKGRWEQYLDLMNGAEIPTKNMITLVYLSMKDYEEAANQEIIKASVERRADQERRNRLLNANDDGGF